MRACCATVRAAWLSDCSEFASGCGHSCSAVSQTSPAAAAAVMLSGLLLCYCIALTVAVHQCTLLLAMLALLLLQPPLSSGVCRNHHPNTERAPVVAFKKLRRQVSVQMMLLLVMRPLHPLCTARTEPCCCCCRRRCCCYGLHTSVTGDCQCCSSARSPTTTWQLVFSCCCC
jgi:hypothetical protein